MKPGDLARLRNVGVVAHIDAGKTTVSERFLYFSGVEHRIGQVDEGTTVLDWMQEERERGITITAAATRLPWKDHAINLVDTPGHVDFTVEVERSLRVLDGAVLVVDAVAGVQAQSETVWRQMRGHDVPSIAFVNKCDRSGADFMGAVGSLVRRLDAPAIPIQYPIHDGDKCTGVVDLLTRRALEFDAAGEGAGGVVEPREIDVPVALADEVGVLRSELVDFLADGDEDLLAAVLEDREPDVDALKRALRARTIACTAVPVLCGAALRMVGVQPVLDAVVDYLPSPLERPPERGLSPDGEPLERATDPDGPFAALAFKLHADAHGDLTFVRVYSGRLRPGDALLNPRGSRKERAARVLRLHADARQPLDEAVAGDIVALTGLKFTGTGDTLCDPKAPIVFEALEFPEPVISMVVEPKSTEDRDKLRAALARLEHEDPTFHVSEDEETGQWVVAGMGELHLEVCLHRLEAEFRVPTSMGKPRVAYREAPRKRARAAAEVDKLLGGKEIYGSVELAIEPTPELAGLEVEWAEDAFVPPAYRAAITEALELGGQVGPRFGYPMVGARIRVVGGRSNPKKDSELGFEQAAAQALREAQAGADVQLLEPVMRFEIQAPDEFASGILSDLAGRSAEVDDVSVTGGLRSVSGTVPLIEMFGYSTVVRSLSQGRASFSMEPAGFRPVPEDELEARGLVWS